MPPGRLAIAPERLAAKSNLGHVTPDEGVTSSVPFVAEPIGIAAGAAIGCQEPARTPRDPRHAELLHAWHISIDDLEVEVAISHIDVIFLRRGEFRLLTINSDGAHPYTIRQRTGRTPYRQPSLPAMLSLLPRCAPCACTRSCQAVWRCGRMHARRSRGGPR